MRFSSGSTRLSPLVASGFGLAALGIPVLAVASPPTPGYPEPVVQWGVQKGETCEDVAKALYGAPRYAVLLQRYNHVACKAGAPLREGLTLVLPEKPTTLPDARLRSINPAVRARPGGGGWAPAAAGMPLFSNYNVNTLDEGRADVEFIDRTRVFLAPNTLVVIYGTANQTRVSKTAPAAVEVDAGEVKAALAALRGETVEVAIKGGGRVSASSRDTVVQRKGERTTVAVFEGKAGVTSGGKAVEVPTNFGTRFVGVAPPAPPRPLPPAPAWASGLGGVVLVAPGAKGVLDATWTAVPGAVQYRIELEREREKPDGTTELEIVSRNEVPATITAFHGEKLELAGYRLKVRAIDKDEYLGVAAEHGFRFVEARLELGQGGVSPHAIEANPYGVLHLGASPELEMALDDGPFGPMLETLDLRRRAPQALRLRRRGSPAAETIPIHYAEVKATLSASAEAGAIALRGQISNVKGIDVAERIRPSARVHLPNGVRTVALTAAPDGSFTASFPQHPAAIAATGAPPAPPGGTRIDIVDDRGVLLGSTEYAAPATPPPPSPADEMPHVPQIGAYAPLWQATTGSDVLPFAPTAPNGATVSVVMLHATRGWAWQGQVRASGMFGPVGVEAALHTDTTDGATAYGASWIGGRVRLLRLEGSALEVAPALRVGFPLSDSGLPVQFEPAVGVGGVAREFTWLVNLGGRFRPADDESGTSVPVGQGFLVATGTMDVLPWMRVNAAIDAHVVVPEVGGKRGLGGVTAGVEMGTVVYGGLGLHLSPWADQGAGPFSAQLAVGVRGVP